MLVRDWQRVDRIDIALSPGNRQPRGLSVVQAILSRAGQPIRVFRNGIWTTARGMGRSRVAACLGSAAAGCS